jgi:hypothetical protein
LALDRAKVVVISGETGCGKSTQVPQFIVEDAVARGLGGRCNIVCTQPRYAHSDMEFKGDPFWPAFTSTTSILEGWMIRRRISAVGVAERVATERGVCRWGGSCLGWRGLARVWFWE